MTDLGCTGIPKRVQISLEKYGQGGYTRCPARSFDVTEADVDMSVVLDFIELVGRLICKEEKRGLSVMFDYKTVLVKGLRWIS